MVQPPLSIRPSALRKSKSQDTDDRHPVETVLTTEGIHHEIKIDDNDRRIPLGVDELASARPSFRPAVVGTPPASKGAITSSPIAPQPIAIADAKVIHESMSYRPPRTEPITIPVPGASPISTPHTPTIGKGHAHDPLEDHLFLNIGTGEDCAPVEDACIVSESPSNVDIDVYETAYQEEIQRIREREEALGPKETASSPIDGAPGDGTRLVPRRPTLYLTRRVENIKALRSQDLIIDGGRTRDELKASIKNIVKKSQQSLDTRLESQQQQGKEDLLSRGWRKGRQFKDLVDEAREIIREEERRDGKRWDTAEDTAPQRRSRSRSSTPTPKGSSFSSMGKEVRGSRSGTPALKEEGN
jgi:[calcium/calmodulin-dependent protein kinase] kinase